jgi:DNA-binding transcriptional regulator YbjK
LPHTSDSPGRYARGIERSREILRATLRLIARDGVAAVTHRAVAREASVSLRATTYYFATKEDLVRDALRFYARANIERADAAARAFPSRKSKLESAVDAVTDVMLAEMRDPEAFLAAEYELILAISREPSYAPEYEELTRLLHQRLEALLAAIGSSEPRRHARLVLATTRGLQIEQLASGRQGPSERAIRASVRVLLRALVPTSEQETF